MPKDIIPMQVINEFGSSNVWEFQLQIHLIIHWNSDLFNWNTIYSHYDVDLH